MIVNQRRTRKWTCLLLEAMDGGTMDPRTVADMCLAYMSEFDVEDMCASNQLQSLDPDEEEDES